MEKYDYRAAVKADILDYLNDSDICPNDYTRDELAQKLHDDLFCEDSVTGNGSGSYTFSRWQSEENLCHNWDLIADACRKFLH